MKLVRLSPSTITFFIASLLMFSGVHCHSKLQTILGTYKNVCYTGIMTAPRSNLNYIDLNVVILPDKDLSLKLIQWSQRLSSKLQTNYVLDTTNYLPHLSLYSARYPVKNKQLIEEAAADIAHNLHSFNISLSGFSFFSGYVFYDAQQTSELIELHETMVDRLNPLREGLISDNQKQLTGLSLDQKKAIQEYGYVSVKKLYMPHISITSLGNPSKGDLVKEILLGEVNSFSVKTLAISRFANYGTFPPPLKTYFINK